ncbi:hypothetical protein LTR56_002479 [Elasticomyces elasticus]|nr:hypothetical protein LTR22_012118 [Elasticomyces elasticus]KAK3657337.1 hypothetical protein LTR56_002479 [Elasticomyces elasticus]KAK4933582.1 hypothetical protein LTR49_000044 [Elasticomyces elasticus]KAK5754777.1 hypothetical protein LTS12_015094 [Elasticomyces elasticus]
MASLYRVATPIHTNPLFATNEDDLFSRWARSPLIVGYHDVWQEKWPRAPARMRASQGDPSTIPWPRQDTLLDNSEEPETQREFRLVRNWAIVQHVCAMIHNAKVMDGTIPNGRLMFVSDI